MASKNSIRMVVGAGLALAAGVAFAAVSEDFEDGANSGTWTGGTVTTENTTPPNVGSPITGAAHTKYYTVAGEVTCENTDTDAASAFAKADFLVCVTEATTDELAAPDSDARIAVAAAPAASAETDPKVSIYTGGNWVEATSATFKLNTWQRLTLVFDYAHGRCQVLLDGVPVVSASGYLAAEGAATNGSWYALASDEQSATTGSVASLKFVGLANIDDVVVTAPVAEQPAVYDANATTTVGSFTVKLNDLAKWGVDATTISTVTLNSTAGMTVAAKLDAGLDPTSETKFNPTAMKLTENGGSASVTVPFELDTDSQYYEVVVSDGSNIQTLTSAENGGLTVGDKSEGKRTLGFTIPSGFTGNVLKFTIKTAAAAPASGN